ncbi:11627_t:CDS:2, partial [Entrophospora sp. SA101]
MFFKKRFNNNNEDLEEEDGDYYQINNNNLEEEDGDYYQINNNSSNDMIESQENRMSITYLILNNVNEGGEILTATNNNKYEST